MSKPKANHYVPRFYLQGFVDPDEEQRGRDVLWVYEAGKGARATSPRACAFENYFYRCAEAEEKGIEIERVLQELENHTAPVLSRLRGGDFQLSQQQRSEFAGFIALMMTRVPFFHDTVDNLAAEMTLLTTRALSREPGALEVAIRQVEQETGQSLNRTPEQLREFIDRGEYTVQQTSKAWTIRMMWQTMLGFIPIIERMQWVFLESSGAEWFLTSDNPVALYDPSAPHASGLASSPLAELTFPLGRRSCLLCRWKGRSGSVLLSPSRVRALNKRSVLRAYRFVFTPYKSKALRQLVDRLHGDQPRALTVRVNGKA